MGTSRDLMNRRSAFMWKILSFPQLTKSLPFPKTHSSDCATFKAGLDKPKPSFPQELNTISEPSKTHQDCFLKGKARTGMRQSSRLPMPCLCLAGGSPPGTSR